MGSHQDVRTPSPGLRPSGFFKRPHIKAVINALTVSKIKRHCLVLRSLDNCRTADIKESMPAFIIETAAVTARRQSAGSIVKKQFPAGKWRSLITAIIVSGQRAQPDGISTCCLACSIMKCFCRFSRNNVIVNRDRWISVPPGAGQPGF
jgi:hypothetical protein